MRTVLFIIMALTVKGCAIRIDSNGRLPARPEQAKVLIVAQYEGAQNVVLEVSSALEAVGMETYLDGTVSRGMLGPNHLLMTSDTSFRTPSQLPFVTTLYPTPATDYTALISTWSSISSYHAVDLKIVDSKTGRLIYTLSSNLHLTSRSRSLASKIRKHLQISFADELSDWKD